MKPIKIGCLFICVALLSCNAKSERSDKSEPTTQNTAVSEILIYGSNTCDHCIDFRTKLDSVGVPYTFKDVETNQFFANELMAKIQAINFQGRVAFPVIDVNGKVMVAPELEKVLVEL